MNILRSIEDGVHSRHGNPDRERIASELIKRGTFEMDPQNYNIQMFTALS